MIEAATRALPLWQLEGGQLELAGCRENHVYRVDHRGRTYALRVHRVGYRNDLELRSELQWLDAAARGGLQVPSPVRSIKGDYVHVLDGIRVSVMSWLPGTTLAAASLDQRENLPSLFKSLGAEMALLHSVSDAWALPRNFTRWHWDRKGLLGESPVWGRFWENPTLNSEDRDLLRGFRNAADRHLSRIEGDLDFGLIHADLVPDNVLISGGRVQLIDFDDGGFGYRLFDLATVLVKYLERPNYFRLKEALFEAYSRKRSVSLEAFDLVMAMRAVTYVGWIADRLAEDNAAMRNARNLRTAKLAIRKYLETVGAQDI